MCLLIYKFYFVLVLLMIIQFYLEFNHNLIYIFKKYIFLIKQKLVKNCKNKRKVLKKSLNIFFNV